MKDLTIIVVNFNTFSYLKTCLTSIRKSLSYDKLDYEVIVIDNASQKQLFEKEFGQKTKLIKNERNLGYGVACNQGIKMAQGKYILLLNPDVVVLDRSINKLLRFIKKKNGFAGGCLLNPDKSIQPSCGLFFTLPNLFLMLFLGGERLGITKFSPKLNAKVDWVSGSCLIGRKKDFLRILFDENIFLYTEEVELLYRANKVGLNCFFCKDAQFVHYGAVSSKKDESVINLYKGLIYFYQKHYSKLQLFLLKSLLFSKACLGIIVGFVSLNKNISIKYKKALTYLCHYENRY